MTLSNVGKRLAASFFCGVFLVGLWPRPASAVIPVGVYAGTIIRGIIAGAGTRAAIPAGANAAKALSASGLFGVSAAAYIVMCGSNYVSGNDCSGTPLAKLRPQGHTGNDGEPAAQTIPATAVPGQSGVKSASCPGDPAAPCTVWASNAEAASDSAFQAYIASINQAQGYCVRNFVAVGGGVGGEYQQWCSGAWTSNGALALSGGATVTTTYTAYTCPAGYTKSGTECIPAAGNWGADSVPSYRNQSGVWIGDPADPDPYTPIANPLVQTVTQPNGQPMRIEAVANADGSITLRTHSQGSVNGQTTTSVDEVRISSAGVPTAVTNIYYGDISTVINQSPPSTQTPATEIEIPTDYARDATVQTTNTKLQKMIDEGLKIKEDGTPEGKSEAQTALEGRLSRGGDGGDTASGSVYPDDDGIRKVILPSDELESKRSSTDGKVNSAFNWAESCSDIEIGELLIPICGSAGAEWLRLALAWVYGLMGIVYLYRRSGDVLAGEA